MKFCLVDPFPARSFSWERQFLAHLAAALRYRGHAATTVRCSDEVVQHGPDAVIIANEAVAKLTEHYTIGFVWNHAEFGERDEASEKAIRSWDLVIPADRRARRFVRDLRFPTVTAPSLSEGDFCPTVMPTRLEAAGPARLGLVRIGAASGLAWERPVLEELSTRVDLNVYGPAGDWDFLPDAYRGRLPAEPDAVMGLLNRHGAALVPSGPAEFASGRPSLHFFEACAAKCLVITNPIEAVSEPFGDSLHYIDPGESPAEIARGIARTLADLSGDPRALRSKVVASSSIHRSRFSLGALVAELVDQVDRRAAAARARRDERRNGPSVSVIMRLGDRPLSMADRALASLRAQDYARIGLILVSYAQPPGFEAWLERLEGDARFLFVRHVPCPRTGVRSHTLWAGFRAVETDLFCNLDDDDELFPNHIGDMVSSLEAQADVALVYSGSVRREEDGILLNKAPRFEGDLDVVVPETREILRFQDFDLSRLLNFECIITSNTWLARRSALYPALLEDPDLEVAEDIYFFIMMAHRHKLAFSGTVSAIYNYRTLAKDNSLTTISPSVWDDCTHRIVRRLARLQFPIARPGMTAINHAGDVAAPRGRPEAEFDDFDEEDFEISFASPSLPSPVRRWSGISWAEPWGRWTDDAEVRIVFRRALPPRFLLAIHGLAFERNRGSAISVAVGSSRVELTMGEAGSAETYEVVVDNRERGDTLFVAIPHPTRPTEIEGRPSSDIRQLGIALSSLRVKALAPG